MANKLLWTEDETRQLEQWLAEKRRIPWIARQLGRTVHSVQNRINRAQHGTIGAKTGGKQPKRETIPCLCCRQLFISWDRCRNRLCPNCGRESVTRYDTCHLMPWGARGTRD